MSVKEMRSHPTKSVRTLSKLRHLQGTTSGFEFQLSNYKLVSTKMAYIQDFQVQEV